MAQKRSFEELKKDPAFPVLIPILEAEHGSPIP
jgi:hypothetical protein